MAEKVTASLVAGNGSLPPGLLLVLPMFREIK